MIYGAKKTHLWKCGLSGKKLGGSKKVERVPVPQGLGHTGDENWKLARLGQEALKKQDLPIRIMTDYTGTVVTLFAVCSGGQVSQQNSVWNGAERIFQNVTKEQGMEIKEER